MKYTLHTFLICALLVSCKQNTTEEQKIDSLPQISTKKKTGQKVQDFVLEGHEILAQQEGAFSERIFHPKSSIYSRWI